MVTPHIITDLVQSFQRLHHDDMKIANTGSVKEMPYRKRRARLPRNDLRVGNDGVQGSQSYVAAQDTPKYPKILLICLGYKGWPYSV